MGDISAWIERLEYSISDEREDIMRRVVLHIATSDQAEAIRVLELVYRAGCDSVDCRDD